MNTALSPEATAYVDAVRERLKGLPIEEAEELVTDLEQHLAELVAEDPGPLADRLGSPQQYATELATSAGWPVHESRRIPLITNVLSGWKEHLRGSPLSMWWSIHSSHYRPGWWVVRALVVLPVWGALQWAMPSRWIWLFAILMAVVSVEVGRRAVRATGWLVADRLATIIGLWAMLVAFANGVNVMSQSVVYTYYDYNPTQIVGPNGVVERIYAFLSGGQPVDVFLYDQNGSPIATNWSEYQRGPDATGEPIDNFYPAEP
jgi:hypothetical protein